MTREKDAGSMPGSFTGAGADSSWQPVQPTSRYERARYRSRQFNPLIGASTAEEEAAISTTARADAPFAPGGTKKPVPRKTVHRGHTKPRAFGSAETAAGGQAHAPADGSLANQGADVSSGAGKRQRAKRPAPSTPPRARTVAARPARTNAGNGAGHALSALIMGALSILVASSSALFGIILAIIAFAQAGKARKNGRKAGIGRVLASIGLALSIICAFVGSGSIISDVFNDLLDGKSYMQPVDSYENSPGVAGGSLDALSLDGSEREVGELAVQQFSKLADLDEETVSFVADILDDDMRNYFGIDHAMLGIDPEETARWALADGTYAISSVYAFDDDEEGSVFADVQVRDTSVLYNALWKGIEDIESTTLEELQGNTSDLEKIAASYRAALEKGAPLTDRFIDVEFLLQDGTWVVDEAYWKDTLRSLYHL